MDLPRRLRIVLIGIVALVWLASRPALALACSCAEGTADWEVVFFGRVVAVIEGEWIQQRLWQEMEGFGSTVALLEVDRIWQGSDRRFALVVGGSGQGDCMLSFVPGASYKISVIGHERGLLYTNTCVGSRPMDDLAP